mgnify:CR=1 FL=1
MHVDVVTDVIFIVTVINFVINLVIFVVFVVVMFIVIVVIVVITVVAAVHTLIIASMMIIIAMDDGAFKEGLIVVTQHGFDTPTPIPGKHGSHRIGTGRTTVTFNDDLSGRESICYLTQAGDSLLGTRNLVLILGDLHRGKLEANSILIVVKSLVEINLSQCRKGNAQ